mgnify:CR=1 FL=1
MGFYESVQFTALLLNIVRNSHGPNHEKHGRKCRMSIFIYNVVSTLNCHCRRN